MHAAESLGLQARTIRIPVPADLKRLDSQLKKLGGPTRRNEVGGTGSTGGSKPSRLWPHEPRLIDAGGTTRRQLTVLFTDGALDLKDRMRTFSRPLSRTGEGSTTELDEGRMTRLSSEHDLLVEQLAALHRGRGIWRPNLMASVGPMLRRALGVIETMDEAEVVRVVYSTLKDATRGLPDDLRLVFRMATGIESNDRLLKDRLKGAMIRLDRGERTMQRRLSAADELVASVLEHRLSTTGPDKSIRGGWYVDALSLTVRLDRARPEFVGDREIVSTQRLTVLTDNVSIPSQARGSLDVEIEVEALDGCTLESLERTSASTWRYRLLLPHPVAAGERHRYSVLVRVPSSAFIRPYAVIVPIRPCREFKAAVVFDPHRPPSGTWVVDGVLPAVLEDEAFGPQLALDEYSTATARFLGLSSGMAYGLRWTDA
jgi:hypothetical protein